MQQITHPDRYGNMPPGWMYDLQAAHEWITKMILKSDLGSDQENIPAESGHADVMATISRYRPRKNFDHEALAADYEAGISYRALREKYGCSHTTIWYAVRRQGVPSRIKAGVRGKITREVWDEILAERKAGVSARKLAERHGISIGHVYRLLHGRKTGTKKSGPVTRSKKEA